MILYKVLVLAFIGEALWETIKLLWDKGKFSTDRIGAMLIGVFLSVFTEIDIMELAGIPMIIPYAGTILTGILISRGSNFVHDILGSINGIYNSRKVRIGEEVKKE